jgi:acyl-CoA thioester hydrolase
MDPAAPPKPQPLSHEALNAFPVVIHLPVEWGDQDAFGHVNNTVYLRWCETARAIYLDRAGMWGMIATDRRGPILASITCNFRRAVTFPDTVHVGARVTRLGNSSLVMEHLIVSEAMGEAAADAESTIVFFDYAAARSLPLPNVVREAIGKMEGREF